MYEWPLNTSAAKRAREEIADTHYILTPPVYDRTGRLIRPEDYVKRIRGATVVVTFTMTRYNRDRKTIVSADLEHLRVVVTPSPPTPAAPRFFKRVLDHDSRFSITQPDFKKVKHGAHAEGNLTLTHRQDPH